MKIHSRTMSIEQAIIDVWQRVLRLEHVGSNDNFFDLGGNSILLMSVHSELNALFEGEIRITDLFEFATVRALANHLRGSQVEQSGLVEVREQAQRQRAAFARQRERRAKGVV